MKLRAGPDFSAVAEFPPTGAAIHLEDATLTRVSNRNFAED